MKHSKKTKNLKNKYMSYITRAGQYFLYNPLRPAGGFKYNKNANYFKKKNKIQCLKR